MDTRLGADYQDSAATTCLVHSTPSWLVGAHKFIIRAAVQRWYKLYQHQVIRRQRTKCARRLYEPVFRFLHLSLVYALTTDTLTKKLLLYVTITLYLCFASLTNAVRLMSGGLTADVVNSVEILTVVRQIANKVPGVTVGRDNSSRRRITWVGVDVPSDM